MAGTTERMDPWRRRVFGVVSSSSAPAFLAMILAPRSRHTTRLVDRTLPLHAALGAAYATALASGVADTRSVLDFRDPDRLRVALGHQDFFLAGWTHYISFDLLVGEWIWRDSLAAGRSARLALLLTWMAGPIGLTLYLAQRLLAPGPAAAQGGPR